MFNRVVGRVSWLSIILYGFAAALARAEHAPAAYEVVQGTTDRVMSIVREAEAYADQDPERYYAQLQEVLDEVVDFRGFARGVMGPYASKRRYDSLNADGKKQMRAQTERFTETIRLGLVRTYGKGLLAFGGSRVEVQRPEDEKPDTSKLSVTQLIYNDTSEPYVIHYQMRRDGEHRWKLRNLIVENVNLGQIYRNQFQAAARDAGGDVDKVIDEWTAVDMDEAEAAEA
jgi:phospholipid transport system substrate-binding protein